MVSRWSSEWDPVVHMRYGRQSTLEDHRLYDQASRFISTGQLHTLLCFHTQPINVIVFNGPLGGLNPREILS